MRDMTRDVVEKDGYRITTLSYGQVRRYGPSVYEFEVEDLRGRPEAEVRKFCTTVVCVADDPRTHALSNGLDEFKNLGNGKYLYQCSHEYAG